MSDTEHVMRLARQEAERCDREEITAADILIGVVKHGRCDQILAEAGAKERSLLRAARDIPLSPQRPFTLLSRLMKRTCLLVGSYFAEGRLGDDVKPDAVVG